MTNSASEQRTRYWRSLSELENTPEFEQFLHREFPVAASEFPDGISRRRWLQLMAASLALGGLTGCRYHKEEFAAFSTRTDQRLPGIPQYFASSFEWAGRPVHVLVSNVDGRPLKVDGNPQHPLNKSVDPSVFKDGKEEAFASAGTDSFTQAAILQLYDPDRASRVATREGGKGNAVPADWDQFERFSRTSIEAIRGKQGESLAILLPPTRSPSVRRLLKRVREQLPKATIATYSPAVTSAANEAVKLATGVSVEALYRFEKAKVIVSLDSDLFSQEAASTLYARQFSYGRDVRNGSMNRLYVVESQYSMTGATADIRLSVPSSQIGSFLVELEAKVDALIAAGGKAPVAAADEKTFDELTDAQKIQRTIEVLAGDLVSNLGASAVVVGGFQPADVQAVGYRLNEKLQNVGKTLEFIEQSTEADDFGAVGLTEFVDVLDKGLVDTVWVLGGNPLFGVASDVKLADSFAKAANRIYVGEYEDETAAQSTWIVPLAHPLEAWGDVLAVDGTYSVGQPQIEPLLNGKSLVTILALLLSDKELDAEKIVRETATAIAGSLNDVGWRKLLHDGFLEGSGKKAAAVKGDKFTGAPATVALDVEAIKNGELEVCFLPSESVYDGRFANNGWLQELPHPVTKLVWDNAAIVSPEMAAKFNLVQGELATLSQGGRTIDLPIFVVPGVASNTIVTHIGYGRTIAGAVGSNVGHDVSALRVSATPMWLGGVEIRPTSRPYKLATTQDHFSIDNLGASETSRRAATLIREGTYDTYQQNEHFAQVHLHHELESLWDPEQIDAPHAWAMTVDLNKCIGCNSCVVACQAENNIPIVGKEQVSRGREMHWIRIDRYFQGDPGHPNEIREPKVVFQPVACVHCEMAPCEQVCPVAATVHTEEGINAMAYNRCIGTRYCANNCPYKVRRFNYFNFNTEYGYFYGWQDKREQANRKLQTLVLNPEVTVRGRGVMEKCTYCVQRVQNGKISARADGRPLKDGDIKTACQAACPSQAIVFGDKLDPNSRVSIMQKDPRNYAMLEELNVKPRTLYLAKLRNVHPRLMTKHQQQVPEHAHHGEGDHAGESHGNSESHENETATTNGNHS